MNVSASKTRAPGEPGTDSPPAASVSTTGAGGRAAAERAVTHNAVIVEVFGRRLELPPGDQLAFLGGLGVLAALEIIEWPVVVAIAAGHALTHSHHGRLLREFGDALEEA